MQISASPKFLSSIKRVVWEQSFLYKFYSFFRWDLRRFFKNVWMFRKALWNYRWWDYTYPLNFLQITFEDMSEKFEKQGIEVDEHRLPKVEKIKRANEILKNILEYNYIELAEKELGPIVYKPLEFKEVPGDPNLRELFSNETDEEKAHSRKVYKLATDLEESQWIELWTIISGKKICIPDNSESAGGKKETSSVEEILSKIPDGSDLRTWWD
jgi:hypothetical protein